MDDRVDKHDPPACTDNPHTLERLKTHPACPRQSVVQVLTQVDGAMELITRDLLAGGMCTLLE